MNCASSVVLSANSLHCDEMGYLCRVPYWKKPMSLSESKLEKQEKNHPGEIFLYPNGILHQN